MLALVSKFVLGGDKAMLQLDFLPPEPLPIKIKTGILAMRMGYP